MALLAIFFSVIGKQLGDVSRDLEVETRHVCSVRVEIISQAG